MRRSFKSAVIRTQLWTRPDHQPYDGCAVMRTSNSSVLACERDSMVLVVKETKNHVFVKASNGSIIKVHHGLLKYTPLDIIAGRFTE